jgi:SAM-dependent methyltransferase
MRRGVAREGFDPAVVRDAYDAIAPEYAGKFGDDLEGLELDRALLGSLAATVGGGLVLDVGCGPAQAGGYLAAQGCRVLGLDLSAGMLASAVARLGALGFRGARADLRQLPLPSRSCAGAASLYVLHHLPREDLPTALSEFGRVLAPGAMLLLATHEGTGEFVADGHPDIRGTLYTGQELADALTRAGFSSVQIRRRDPLPHERQSGRVYATAVVPRIPVTSTAPEARARPGGGQ